jgi:hypothetical protein
MNSQEIIRQNKILQINSPVNKLCVMLKQSLMTNDTFEMSIFSKKHLSVILLLLLLNNKNKTKQLSN